jgi:hypothetical protein
MNWRNTTSKTAVIIIQASVVLRQTTRGLVGGFGLAKFTAVLFFGAATGWLAGGLGAADGYWTGAGLDWA